MPEKFKSDVEAIVYRLTAYEFSWDIERSLEYALFRTYAVPSISGLLAKTGEFAQRPQKRYDDTELLLSEVVENGLQSERGSEAIARINEMHARYRISNDDMLYVLSTFILEPMLWMERFGRRPFTAEEQETWFEFYCRLGERLHITDIPVTLAAFERFNRQYEAANFRYAESNRLIGNTTLELLLGFYLPRSLWWLGRPVACSLMDDRLISAMGFRKPPEALRRVVLAGMRGRALLLRVLPQRTKPRHVTERPRPTYPGGYQIAQLGVFPGRGAPPHGPKATDGLKSGS